MRFFFPSMHVRGKMHVDIDIQKFHVNLHFFPNMYRYGLGGVFLHFILESNWGGEGPVRGLRGGGRRGWCEEWARSG
jgi:hypothetical protein